MRISLLLLIAAMVILAGCTAPPMPPVNGLENNAECGGHSLGETWEAEDGCNTCTCTATGSACTEMACVPEDFCEGAFECEQKELVHAECVGNWKCVSNRCKWECLVEGETDGGGSDGNITEEETAEECTAGWKCKDSSTKANQKEDCSWENETDCEFGCLNGQCKSDTCIGVTCADNCDGKIRKYNGNCVDGTCQYSAQECSYQCTDAACVADPCAGISCAEYCEAGVHYKNGACNNGNCSFESENCPWGCDGTACKLVEHFGCKYVGFQEILNADTLEFLLQCPPSRTYCKAGYPYCCNYDMVKKQHYNCADCNTQDCGASGECYGVNCNSSYCEGGKRFFGVCRNGKCEYDSEVCPEVCSGGDCVTTSKIFITSQEFGDGSMGGIAGVDAKCQAAATAAGLSGTWIGLVSDSSTNAIDRLPDRVFTRMDGEIIATSKADLFDGTINVPINLTEFGTSIGDYGYAWTGSLEGGTHSGYSCYNWLHGHPDKGTIGDAFKTGIEWINASWNITCLNVSSFYCVSIPA